MNGLIKSCCFTGHRIIKNSEELTCTVRNQIVELVKKGATEFYAGGAIGWDTLCAQEVLRLRRKYPQIRFHLVLPCPEAEQAAKWTGAQKEKYHQILLNSDSAEIVSDKYFYGCMKKRNRRLVELADICVCYYNEKTGAGGTAQTVRMAQDKNIPVINLFKE